MTPNQTGRSAPRAGGFHAIWDPDPPYSPIRNHLKIATGVESFLALRAKQRLHGLLGRLANPIERHQIGIMISVFVCNRRKNLLPRSGYLGVPVGLMA